MHLKRDTWDETQPLEPWLRAIARHKLVDHLRRRGFRDHVDIDDYADSLEAAVDVDASATIDSRRLLASFPSASVGSWRKFPWRDAAQPM